MPDRRTLKRRHLLYYLRVSNAHTRRLLGHLVDLTPDGVMLMSKRRIRVGRTILLRMTRPGEPGEGKMLEFEATSLWNRRDINTDFWDIGFQSTGLTRRQLNDIETLIYDYGFRD